jgi:hypothetical protein
MPEVVKRGDGDRRSTYYEENAGGWTRLSKEPIEPMTTPVADEGQLDVVRPKDSPALKLLQNEAERWADDQAERRERVVQEQREVEQIEALDKREYETYRRAWRREMGFEPLPEDELAVEIAADR